MNVTHSTEQVNGGQKQQLDCWRQVDHSYLCSYLSAFSVFGGLQA